MKKYSEIVAPFPSPEQFTKPPSRAQQRRRRKQQHKPRQYQPVVIVETTNTVYVVDAEVLLAMLLLGRASR